jgi:hypothetical protein
VEQYADALLGEAAKRVGIAEAVEKGVSPRIAPTGGVGDLGDPDRLARLIAVTKRNVKAIALVG